MTVDIMPTSNGRLPALTTAPLDNTTDALARLAQWVEAAHNAHALVAPLVDTPFVPEAYRPKVDPRATPEQRQAAHQQAVAAATAAVLQGLSLGLDPLVSLQQIYVVHGRPGMYARIKVALVTSRGHEVWVEDLTDTRAVVCGRRAGSQHVERVVVTMDQARKAGWTRNQAYSTTPQDMLYARAASRVCDRIAPDVLMGIAAVEEIRDEIHATVEVGPATRTVSPRRRQAAPAPAIQAAAEEPPLDEPDPTGDDFAAVQEAAAQPDPEPAVEMATPAQTRKLYALLRDTGRAERSDALRYLSLLLSRDITSTKDLTKAEARIAIDDLEAQMAAADVEPAPEQPELEP